MEMMHCQPSHHGLVDELSLEVLNSPFKVIQVISMKVGMQQQKPIALCEGVRGECHERENSGKCSGFTFVPACL